MTDDAQKPPYDKLELDTPNTATVERLKLFFDAARAEYGTTNATCMMTAAFALTLDQHLPGFLLNLEANASLISETGESDQ